MEYTTYDVEIPTEALHAFHAPERRLYRRMVIDNRMEPALAKRIIAYWLWFQEADHSDNLIPQVIGYDDQTLRAAALQAEGVLVGLVVDQVETPANLPPGMTYQVRDEAARGIRYFLRAVCERAFEDITREAEEASRLRMEELLHQIEQLRLGVGFGPGGALPEEEQPPVMHYGGRGGVQPRYNNTPPPRPMMPTGGQLVPYGRGFGPNSAGSPTRPMGTEMVPYTPHGEGSSRLAPQMPDAYRLPPYAAATPRAPYFGPRPSTFGGPQMGFGRGSGPLALPSPPHEGGRGRGRGAARSPIARPGSRASTRRNFDPELEERTLFVTFSNGYPLTEEDLYVFFMNNFGDVQMVDIPVPASGEILFAYVSFYSVETIFRVLNGNATVKFMYKGRHLWARRSDQERMHRSR